MKSTLSLLKAIFSHEIVLEELDGRIEDEDGDEYRVKLFSRANGDELSGYYSKDDFKNLGVDHRFVCRTIARGDWTKIEIKPVPDAVVTDEQVREIRESIERDLPLINDDY